MPDNLLETVVTAIDQYEAGQEFTLYDIIELTKGSQSALSAYIKVFNNRGLIKKVGGRPPKYVRTKDLTPIYKQGGFKGMWSRLAKPSKQQIEPEEEEVEIEIDTQDFFDAMEPEEFAALVSHFIAGKVSIIEPLQAEINRLKSEFDRVEERHTAQLHSHEATIRQLREELKTERSSVMGLKADLFEAKRERAVKREEPVKTLLIKGGPSQPMESGGGVGKMGYHRIRMHSRPNAPQSVKPVVVQHIKRKKD